MSTKKAARRVAHAARGARSNVDERGYYGRQVAGKRVTDLSLMPAGLLDKLTDAEIADLYAYLKDLGPPKDRP